MFSNQLKLLRERIGISQKKLATDMFVSQQTVGKWELNQATPNPEMLTRIAQYFNVSLDFLCENPDASFSSDEILLVKKYRSLDSYGQRTITSLIDIEYERSSEEQFSQTPCHKHITLRLSNQSAAAGTGTYLGPESFDSIKVEDNNTTRKIAFCVPVCGNSMEPAYYNGDILMVSADDPDEGEIGIWTMDGMGYVKKRGKGVLISLNPDYKPIKMDESIRCNGKVIGILPDEWIIH